MVYIQAYYFLSCNLSAFIGHEFEQIPQPTHFEISVFMIPSTLVNTSKWHLFIQAQHLMHLCELNSMI